MAILEYIKVLRRRWYLVLACFVVASMAGFILSPEQPPEPKGSGYQASLTLIPSADVTTGINLHLAAHLATTPDVAALAADQLPEGIEPPGAGAISASVNSEVGSLSVTATDRDANRAGILAGAYADATIRFLIQTTARSYEDALSAAEAELDVIQESIASLQNEIRDDPSDSVLQAQLQTEMTRYEIVFHRVQDLLSAEEPPEPLQVLGAPQITRLDPGGIAPPRDRGGRALLAGALGLVLGLALAFMIDRMDNRLRERDEFEEAFGLPVLAEIPRMSYRARKDHTLVTAVRPDSVVAEAYRSLRSAIALVSQGSKARESSGSLRSMPGSPQVLVVTGARGEEGKSSTVVNLAAAIAETGRSVLVIDCDFRKPEAHMYLDARPGSRLADLVETNFSGYLDQIIRSTAVPNVSLVTTLEPVPHPAGMASRLSGIIADARDRADVVLIDSSPLLITSDALDVLPYADVALVAARVGRTTYDQASQARRVLQRAGVPLLGVVLTGTAPHRGTPYGQPSRRRVIVTRLAQWARSSGLDGSGRMSPRDDIDVAPDAEPDRSTVVAFDKSLWEREAAWRSDQDGRPGSGHSEWDDTIEIRPTTAQSDSASAAGRRRATPPSSS